MRIHRILTAVVAGSLIGPGMMLNAYQIDDEQNKRITALEQKINTLSRPAQEPGKAKKEPDGINEPDGIKEDILELWEEIDRVEAERQAAAGASPLSFSGFFDVGFVNNPRVNASDKFALGAFELDLEMAVSDKINASAAMVADGGAFEVGVAFLDIHFLEKDIDTAHPPRGHYAKHSGLKIGLFDVPFGLDYLVYATPDRRLVSAPITTDMMFDGGWGDIGVMPYFATCCSTLNIYYLDGENVDDTATPVRALGGRFSMTPLGLFEIGASAAGFFEHQRDTLDKMRFGGHAMVTLFDMWESKAEYIIGKDNKTTSTEEHQGYYVQTTVDFGPKTPVPLYLTLRYGMWNPEYDFDANANNVLDDDDVSRFTGGIGWCINDSAGLVVEHQVNSEQRDSVKTADDQTSISLFISF